MGSVWRVVVPLVLVMGCDPNKSGEPVIEPPDVDTDALFDVSAARTPSIPLGETLFFDGDDYLAFWGADHPDAVEIVARPEGSVAEIVADGSRWTPDLSGSYTLKRGGEELELVVSDEVLTADTFLNYNYTPVMPVAKVDESTLLVTVPYGNVVKRVSVDADGATVEQRVPVGGWPTSVVMWEGSNYALVAQTARDSMGFLDLTTWELTDAIRVGDEPAGIVVDGDVAYVTASGADEVVQVDLTTRTVTGRVSVGRDPRSMALDVVNDRLFVASLMSSNTTPLGPLQDGPVDPSLQRDIAIIDTRDFTLTGYVPEVGTLIRGLSLREDGNELIAAVSHSRNTRHLTDAHVEPHGHALARIDVTPGGELAVTDIDLDKRDGSAGPAPSPFTMAQVPGEDALLVTLSAGGSVMVLDPATLDERSRIPTGSDPRGLVFAQGRAWTTTWLDNALVGIPLPVAEATEPDVEVALGDDPRSEAIRVGQRMFNDAAFSARKDFSCNNCHIDGLTDGLVWNLLADGNVNTIAFRNIGGTDPFLWGGQLPTLFDFSREVLRLVGANVSGAEMELLTTYMQSVTAPPNPYALPGGKFSQSGLRGQDLFFATVADGGAGCGTCHNGPLYTNATMAPGKTEGKSTDVPALIGVYDTAPYGREGQWHTVEDMIVYAAEYTGASLGETAIADLSQFVREIPGDALYLNAATPLSGADHVWFETALELTFSAVLVPGQKDLFRFEMVEIGRTEPVSGKWSVSGRVARFTPDEPLSHDTSYRMTAAAGLESSFGQMLYDEVKVDFTVGGVPELDVSGDWEAHLLISESDLSSLGVGNVNFDVSGGLSLLQATGGNITGVVTTRIDEGDVDHVRGVTSGTTVVLEPFRAVTDFGDILVEESEYQMVDDDGDGQADWGQGSVSAFGVIVPVDLERTRYPDSFSQP
jgi:YVTN family beta-propeller protein